MSDRGPWAHAGDTFFTRSSSWLGRAIRWGEREPGEEPTWANHTGVVVKPGWIRRPENPLLDVGPDAIVIEALWKTRRGHLKLNGTKVRVFRPIPPYNEQELQHFRHEAETYVGSRYGVHKLLGFLVKRFTKGRIDPTQWYFWKARPICSYLAAWVNQKAQSVARIMARGEKEYPFGMMPQSACPDEMMDYCEAHLDEWEEVK